MLSKVWPKGKIALTILVAFLASCEGVIFAYLFKVVIEALHDHQLQELKTTILIVLGLYAVLILFYYLFNRLKNDFVRSFNYYYKTEIVAHYFTAPTLFRDRYGEKVVSFLLNDLKQVETTYSKVFFDLFFYIFFALTSLIYSLYLDYRLSLIFTFFSVIPMAVPWILRRRIKESSEIWTQHVQNYTSHIHEIVAGLGIIQTFKKNKLFLTHNQQETRETEDSLYAMNNLQALAHLLLSSVSIACFILPLFFGSILVFKGYSTLALLIAVFMSSDRIISPLKVVVSTYNLMLSARPLLNKIHDFLEEDLVDQELKQRTIIVEGNQLKVNEHALITNLGETQLKIHSRDKILLVGESGAGKSILLKALASGLLTPWLDPTTSKKLKTAAYIAQDAFAFEAGLDFNLAFDDVKDLTDVKKNFQITRQFPTQIESGGGNLSGGQLKRLALGRAVTLLPKQLLLFDEPYQGLNRSLEQIIEEYLLNREQPLIIASHQLLSEHLEQFDSYWVIDQQRLYCYDNLDDFLANSYFLTNSTPA